MKLRSAPPSPPSSPATSRAEPANGIHDAPLAHLPPVLRGLAVRAELAVGSVIHKLEHLLHAPPPPPQATTAQARAQASLDALEQQLGNPVIPGVVSDRPGGLAPTAVWPQGQLIAGALDLARLTGDYRRVDQLFEGLSLYRDGAAYAPDVNGGHKFWDDNAWIGLDLMQAFAQTKNRSYLERAEQLFPFMTQGLAPGGGLYWEQGAANPTRNTCANAPAIELALRLYQATNDSKYLDFAKNLDGFLEKNLRSPEGLYFDHLDAQGNVNRAFYSYNQGSPIGADLAFFRATGDRSYLDRATQTANAALDYFGQDDRLWHQAPAFNAIFFRNLLALDAVSPNPRYRQALDQYLNRVWTQARDPETGLFTQGGIGHYGPPGNALDQGALTQLYALSAWPASAAPDIA